MTIVSKRLGALALATTIFASAFSAAGSGAVAQDRADPETIEQVQIQIPSASDSAETQPRFVASETVQDIPAEPEQDDVEHDAASLRELVGAIDNSTALSAEMMCLAQAVYFEARGEPLDGQLAVARVVINRAESATFPDDYCSVVTQRAQFSFVRNGRIPTPPSGAAAWDRARAIARIAHRDLWDSPVEDSLYFHATHVRPSWAGRMTARATINRHIFYR